MMRHVDRITIIGTGLLGGSLGLALRAKGFAGRIIGIGRHVESVQLALQRGCIDQIGEDLGDAVAQSQLVVLATPLRSFDELFQQIARHDHPGLIVTDVGSTKREVCALASKWLPTPSRFVGSHPMAGGERHGPVHARADLFDGKPCIITASPDTHRDALATVEQLWDMVGMRVIHLPAEVHDQQVAMISHLPHLVASLLVDLASRQGDLRLASTGFGDTTRVASGSPEVWLDIFVTNQDAIIDAIDGFADRLAQFRDALLKGDQQQVLGLLERSKDARDQWPAAHFDRRRSTGSD